MLDEAVAVDGDGEGDAMADTAAVGDGPGVWTVEPHEAMTRASDMIAERRRRTFMAAFWQAHRASCCGP